MKKKILLGYKFEKEGFKSLEEDFDLIYPETHYFPREELLARIPDADVLVPNFGYKTDSEIIGAGNKLQLIANFGVGYDNVDVAFATGRGIAVSNTPNSVLEPTAELCFALILAAARRIGFYNSALRTEKGLRWGLYDNLGTSLYGKTLGIFGMGRIGQAVARRAVASGMQVIYNNRKPLEGGIERQYGAEYVDFEALLRRSDVLSVNAPATPDTFHLFGAEAFRQMKKDAVFVNVARGSLVDEQALAAALQNGEIGSAGLDVFEREPHIAPALLSLENVVVSPHAGTKTAEGRLEMQREVADNIIRFFSKKSFSRVN